MTLVLLAALALLVLGLSGRIVLTYRLHHEAALGAAETQRLWQDYAAQLSSSVPQRSHCVRVTVGASQLCLWENPVPLDASLPPILAPERGYSRASLPLWRVVGMNGPTIPCLRPVRLPEELSEDGLHSLRSCTTLNSLREPVRIDGNLLPASKIFESKTPRVIVLGSVLVEHLKVRPPLTLFAAGEILIKSLEVIPGAQPAPITLISATGRVTVHSYSGPALLSVVSPESATVPPDAEGVATSLPQELFLSRIIEGSF
ncbi:MAG: hypothetical protein EBZ48_06565 [Proteobacteria bacterium]|nr:hypothetical protein [Pseudomonadota bacterium]